MRQAVYDLLVQDGEQAELYNKQAANGNGERLDESFDQPNSDWV